MQSTDLTADLYKCADITLSYLFSDNFQAPTFPIRAGSLSNLSRSRLDRQETVNTAVLIAICSSTGIITKRNTPKQNGISMALLTGTSKFITKISNNRSKLQLSYYIFHSHKDNSFK